MISVKKPGSPADILEHHGVKGQRWGIVKKDDTSSDGPSLHEKISARRSARREEQAKRHDAAAATLQSHIDSINAKPSGNRFNERSKTKQVKEIAKYRDQNTKAAADIRAGHLTDHQKHVIEGAVVVGGILAAYGTYKLVDSGTANQMLTKSVRFNRNSQLAKHMSADEIMKDIVPAINPNFGARGTKMNCRRCTFAYEMRRRGLDVAATHSSSGTGQTAFGLFNALDPESNLGTGKLSIMKTLSKEARQYGEEGGPLLKSLTEGGLGKDSIVNDMTMSIPSSAKAKTIFDAIAKNPNGSRGELGVSYAGMGGAHSMAWEVIDGIPHVFDTQSGVHYSVDKFTEDFAPNVAQAAITRLDNVNLNTGYLRKWVKNA